MDFTFTENQALAVCGAFAVELRLTQDRLRASETREQELMLQVQALTNLVEELKGGKDNADSTVREAAVPTKRRKAK